MTTKINPKVSPGARKAVIYLSTASVALEGEEAISRQREACERMAHQLGVEVARVYADRGHSGGFRNRPGLRAMLSGIAEEADIGWVIVDSLKVLSRSVAKNYGIQLALERLGVAIVTSYGRALGDNPTEVDRFVEEIHASVAELHQRSAR